MVLRCLSLLAFQQAVFSFATQAQAIEPSDLNPGGGSSVIGGQVYEYALGQIIPSSIQDPHTPGVLQPSWSVAAVVETSTRQLNVFVYPDPMENVLYLQSELDRPTTLVYALLDASGKMIFRREVRLSQGREKQEIDVSHLAAGNYLLNVTSVQGQTPLKTSFKLQKHH